MEISQHQTPSGHSAYTPAADAQLALGAVDDPLEKEADDMADRVMRMPDTPLLQRKCAACEEEDRQVQRKPAAVGQERALPERFVPPTSSGQPLDRNLRDFFEPRFDRDLGKVRLHSDTQAAESARSVGALAYTTGQHIVFAAGQYQPQTDTGRHLMAHELAHTVQQSQAAPNIGIQRRPAPYIKQVTVHLNPDPGQSADLEWEGTAPTDASGSDHFTVSTGKGYSNDEECTRQCCSDPDTQCAPPWDQPGKRGSCCTYTGNNFWTAKPLPEHNTWKWWTPIQPYYSTRGIALHGHPEVTGKPIGHGCVRMHDDNAKRIFDYSNGTKTKVVIDGKAAPVQCDEGDKCASTQ